MKNLWKTYALIGAITIGLNACSDEDPCANVTCNADQTCVDGTCVDNSTSGNEVITDNISTSTTWTNDKIYELSGRITVLDGATLTIEQGTIIKGRAGTGANATALLVARGGMLIAEGTATNPIIFTSVADEIDYTSIANGDFTSPNLDPDQNGFWGGLIVLGSAPISASDGGTDVTETNIEGIPSSDQNGLYGGNDLTDNSGTLKYISIRHGGTNIGAGNEINGLTLGGVGSGTTIEHIEIVGNQDDGIELFGGTVNVKNILIWNNGDDAIDTDQAWSGTLDNFMVITPGQTAFELDGPEGTATGRHTIKNGDVILSSTDREPTDFMLDTDATTEVNLEDIYFTNLVTGLQIQIEANSNYTDIVVNVPAGSTLDDFLDDTNPGGITSGTTTKANRTAFSGWTWANQASAY